MKIYDWNLRKQTNKNQEINSFLPWIIVVIFHFGLIPLWSHATHFQLAKNKLHYFKHQEKLNFYEWKNPTTQYVAHCMYGAHSCLLVLLQLGLPFGLCMALVHECTALSWAVRNSRSVQLSAQKWRCRKPQGSSSLSAFQIGCRKRRYILHNTYSC